MQRRRFKFLREDFGDLPVRLEHLRLYISFFEDRVEVTNTLRLKASTSLQALDLDARDLEIHGVAWIEGGTDDEPGAERPLDHELRSVENKLRVFLPRRLEPGDPFRIRTRTTCRPSEHILEGIYRDTTPEGAPQQYMSLCQQWGFQRIAPILDDCRAKCTMTTTLEGDARYTHLISNGNISRRHNPEGRPVLKPGDPGRQVITYENPVPMAPYLFIACAGTWDTLEDRVTYPDGRTVRLEYLVPPGRAEQARIPMEILKDAVLWVRETQGYTYSGETYRTICMNKSNFGGMENLGNTTIVTDAALIDEHSLDSHILYAHAVIVHEFEHNQCGSETTMETPFDMWLNEAFTVDVERRYMADRFDPAFIRLQQVDSIRNPLLGPLAIEDGGHAGRIVREGFNDPDELVDAVTYVKAAEVIRMLRLLLGEDVFRRGKDIYFTRYRHGNANTDQFFACFEEVSSRSLDRFKRQWLYRIGYPAVRAETSFDPARGRFEAIFRQDPEGEAQEPFPLPIALALVAEDGRDIPGTAGIFECDGTEARWVVDNLRERPAFASMNRGASFYGTFHHVNATPEERRAQVLKDPDPFNRVEAFRLLTDRERVRLLLDPNAEIDGTWLDLYGRLLDEPDLPSSLRAYFLRIDEQPLDRKYAAWYPELVAARDRLMKEVNRRYRDDLVARFHAVDTRRPPTTPRDGIEERLLKSVLLDLIAVDDSEASHRIILDHFRSATNATDRVAALSALNRSSAPQRREVLEQVYRDWHGHLSGYANYLKVVAGGSCDDVFEMIEREKNRPSFDITQPTWSRALFVTMAANTRKVWTDEGIQWIADRVVELAPVNSTVASRLLNTFQQVNRLRPPLKEKVREALRYIADRVPDSASATVAGQVRSYLGDQ